MDINFFAISSSSLSSLRVCTMTTDPLISCWIKIDRAKQHFEDLYREVSGFKSRKPYSIRFDHDSEPGYNIAKIVVHEPIPEIWSGVVGDIIHNCRSSLDNFATALVIANGVTCKSAIEDTYFPIKWDLDGLSDDRTKRFFKRTNASVEKLIRRIEPYRGGKCDALFRLHRLDNLDKHQAIIPVGSLLRDYAINSTDIISVVFSDVYPLEDGHELFRMVAVNNSYLDTDIKLVFDVAFGKGQIVDGQPLLPTLKQLIEFTERILHFLARKLFQS